MTLPVIAVGLTAAPGETAFDLAGDTVTEGLKQIFGSVYDGDPDDNGPVFRSAPQHPPVDAFREAESRTDCPATSVGVDKASRSPRTSNPSTPAVASAPRNWLGVVSFLMFFQMIRRI